jgi:hypothetical protein
MPSRRHSGRGNQFLKTLFHKTIADCQLPVAD